MQAYHNDETIKQKYIQRMRDHIAADELVRGLGVKDGKGCAVWCTLNNYNHKAYETELGIPEWLARVEDCLFEGMNQEKSKTFPLLFLEAIKIGADLDKIKAPFMIFILESTLSNFDNKEFDYIVDAIKTIIELYKTGENDEAKWSSARALATASAKAATETAAKFAARVAAEAAAAGWVAAEAADWWAVVGCSPAEAARYAAWAAARCAAWAAARSGATLAGWSVTRHAAWYAAYDKYADKLLDLIKECK